jgi:hypothetical protein
MERCFHDANWFKMGYISLGVGADTHTHCVQKDVMVIRVLTSLFYNKKYALKRRYERDLCVIIANCIVGCMCGFDFY